MQPSVGGIAEAVRAAKVKSWLQHLANENTIHYVADGGGGPEIRALNERVESFF